MDVNPEGELMLRRLIELRMAVAKFVDALEAIGPIHKMAALKNLRDMDTKLRELEEEQSWRH